MKFYDIINTKTDFLTDQIKPLRENSVSLHILSDSGKYGPEETPCLDTFYAMQMPDLVKVLNFKNNSI